MTRRRTVYKNSYEYNIIKRVVKTHLYSKKKKNPVTSYTPSIIHLVHSYSYSSDYLLQGSEGVIY